jgi:hypothetical protein
MTRLSRSTLRIPLVVLLGVALVAGLIGLWLFLVPTPRFFQPSGPYLISTRMFHWTDSRRPEIFTADRGDHRRLVVQVWYPSSHNGPRQRYIDQAPVLGAIARRLHLPPFLLGRLRNASTHATRDGRIEKGRWPVLIHPTGFSGFRSVSLFWIEEMVSHGYVVVSLDQPGTAAAAVWKDGTVVPVAEKSLIDRYMPLALAANGRSSAALNGVALPDGILPYLAADLSFVLDQLQQVDARDPLLRGALDLKQVGVFGMSLGGYVGPEACHRDGRFKACLAVDAGKSGVVAREGLDQPAMVISRDAVVMREERRKAGGWPENEIAHTIATQRALFEHSRDDAFYVTMNGMHLVNWTVAPLWSPLLKWFGLAGPIDPHRGFALTNACTRWFFDRYLKSGREDASRCGSEATAGEVRLETRWAGGARP